MSQDALVRLSAIIEEVVAPKAATVDRTGTFPDQAIEALGAAGLLGAVSAQEVGGLALGPRGAARVVELLAGACGSTAMIACMHYAGTAVLEKYAPEATRRAAAAGRHLSTLAFSEVGSRSQFWAPVSTATAAGDDVSLTARKSFVTSASRATAYVWSSKPLAADGPSTIWLVPRDATGLRIPAPFDGLGLRGNDSAAVTAESVTVPKSAMLGPDGGGFDVMLGVVLPLFNVMTAAFSVGVMNAATEATARHAAGVRFEHAGSALADLPTIRAFVARMRTKTDAARALLLDTLDAMEEGRDDATLRVLECKAVAGESATEVLDLGMRVTGGAALRRDLPMERLFRDARASTVMAPTTDQLYDFIGKAVCGLPVFG